MASKRKKSAAQPLTGEALVRAMVADEKLVRETNEAFDRHRAGDDSPGIFVPAGAIKAWLDDPSRPDPLKIPPLSPDEEVDPAHSRRMDGAYTMASKRKKNIPAPLTGEALAQAMVANKKLVRESNEAFDRLRAGEAGDSAYAVRAIAIKAWLNDSMPVDAPFTVARRSACAQFPR